MSEEIKSKLEFSKEQLFKLEKMIFPLGVDYYSRKEAFLIKQQAIIKAKESWVVNSFAGLKDAFKETPLGHFYTHDAPYHYWLEAFYELEKYLKHKDFARNQELLSLDKLI